ncbi:MarR family winged helix-turn-helix transcriptional regulator [Mycobacteroides abscessus]|uniref:MarR family winged helix-turn-helix transcriptional regulator n=1 Tax=Mycobacteroides abscessus TaxID=36809 RepID=UPI002106290D|nr:MarR family transcriptional regulator [Mycobacteroides abscessus]
MTNWLDADEQRIWRGFIHMFQYLTSAFGEGFAEAGLSDADFALLVPLSEAPEGQMRARDLAREVSWDKSRLSKHVGRMARRGLVRREDCAADARGSVVVLTDQGRALIEHAAPIHVDAVRKVFIDRLSASDMRALDRIVGKVLAGKRGALEEPGSH